MRKQLEVPPGLDRSPLVRGIDALTDTSGLISAAAVIGMMGIICYEVISRYVFNAPTYWVTEVATYVFVAIWVAVVFVTFAAWQMGAFNLQEYVHDTRDWGLLSTPQWIPQLPVTLGYLLFVIVTPPVGIILFVLRGISGDVPLREIVFGVLPFVLIMLGFIVFLYLFPDVVMWLPNRMMSQASAAQRG